MSRGSIPEALDRPDDAYPYWMTSIFTVSGTGVSSDT